MSYVRTFAPLCAALACCTALTHAQVTIELDVTDPVFKGMPVSVAQMKYRMSHTNWDQSIDNGPGTADPANFIQANLGNVPRLDGTSFIYTIDHIAGEGITFRLEETPPPKDGHIDSTLSWGTFAVPPAGLNAPLLNGIAPGAPYNVIEVEGRATRDGSTLRVTYLGFQSLSPNLMVSGSLPAGDISINPAFVGAGGLPGFDRRFLIADGDLSATSWRLQVLVTGERDASAAGDETVRLVTLLKNALPDETDPCGLPGRPAMDGTDDRVARGFIVGWAVNNIEQPIRWNHLSASATTVNYRDAAAWEHPGTTAAVVNPAISDGGIVNMNGILNFNGVQYAVPPAFLLFNFQTANSTAFTGSQMVTSDTTLTLVPMDIDLRHNSGAPPLTTKAFFDVWNENEDKFSGAFRCVTCWDSTLISAYGVPNHFRVDTLLTDFGKARINGVAAPQCEGSVATALLGVTTRSLTFVAPELGGHDTRHDSVGTTLHGLGTRSATIIYDLVAGPEESPELATQKRMAPTEKGSFFILPSIEVRWDRDGNLIQDTFISLTNDKSENVEVMMYFVNGDAPIYEEECDRFHPGWNFVDVRIHLTGDQPVWWSALSGQPHGVSPWTVIVP
jgi:hypothetical protein